MSRRSILAALVSCSFVVCLGICESLAQVSPRPQGPNRSTISGYVFGPERSPVSQAAVELRNDVNMVIGRTRTSGSGQFSFFGVPSGRFSVTVIPLGTNLEEQSREVEIAGIGARGMPVPDNAQLDFNLKPRKGSEVLAQPEVIFAQEVPKEAVQIYQTAIADIDAQRTEDAIRGLRRAIAIFPNYYHALDRLGGEEIKSAKYEDAVKTFRAAVGVHSRSFSSWYGLGFAYLALEKWEASVESITKALELDKNSVNALIVMGLSQRGLRRFDDAEKALVRAKDIDNAQTPDIYWHLALLYAHNLKKYREAADTLELYLKANAAMPDSEKKKIKILIKQFREKREPSD